MLLSSAAMAASHSSDEQEVFPIQDLPPECLAHVLGFVTAVKDQTACSEVCRAWKLVDDHARSALSISLSRYQKTAPTPEVLARLLHRFQNLTSLTLFYMELSPGYLEVLSLGGRRISNLCMRQCKDNGLDTTQVHLPALTSVTLIRLSELSTAGLVNLLCDSKHLKSLSIDGCSQISDGGMEALCTQCPRLVDLSMDRLYGVSGRGIANGCPNLTRLNCLSAKVDAPRLLAICKGCPMLAELVFNSTALDHSSDYEVIKECRRLQTLELQQPHALQAKSVVVILEKCTELLTLRLLVWASKDLADTRFPPHAKLTHIDLTRSTLPKADQLVLFVGTLFPSLRHLKATGTLDPEVVDRLTNSNPRCKIEVEEIQRSSAGSPSVASGTPHGIFPPGLYAAQPPAVVPGLGLGLGPPNLFPFFPAPGPLP